MVDGAGTGEAEPRPMAFARSHSEGLGLDGGRGRRPLNRKKSAHQGWQLFSARDGSRMAEITGSVHDSPVRKDAQSHR